MMLKLILFVVQLSILPLKLYWKRSRQISGLVDSRSPNLRDGLRSPPHYSKNRKEMIHNIVEKSIEIKP